MLFYTVGAIVQLVLVGRGVSDYIPYADRFGLYEHAPGWQPAQLALDKHWKRYLDGGLTYEEALAKVVRELPEPQNR